MNPPPFHITGRDPDAFKRFMAYISAMPPPYTIEVRKGGPRSLNQNALLHKWFGQIAEHYGDRTALDVKGQCHLEMGVPIRMRNQQFAWIWERATAGMTYEKKTRLCASEILAISSGMTTRELREYLDQIEQLYRPLGVPLVIPREKQDA